MPEEDELEIELPSDSVPAALDKTVTDQEHDIAFMVEEARASAMRGNFFKAESLLKRICKLTTRLHGAASLELAAHLSKLAAVQDSAGKAIESKLSWNRALYIFEINRAPSPNPESASSAKNRSKRRKAIRREIVQMGGKEVDKVDSGKETKGGKGIASTMSAKSLAPNRTAAAKAKASASQPPSSQRGMNVEPRKKQPKPIALQVLYKIPHWSMQSADAAVINTTHIHVDQLTPRTRQAMIERDVNPNHLRIRDLHSFYSENPKMDLQERRRKFVHWCKRREFLWKELLEDRYVLDLSLQSQGRLEKMEAEFAQMAARRKAKIFGLDKGKNFDASGVTKSVLPPPSWDFKFKGSVAAAIDAMSDAPLMCPACQTSWDFKQTPCRICNKKVDWTALQQSVHRKARDLKNMLDRKAKLAKIRKRKKDAEEQRLLDLALKIAKQKAEARKAQQTKVLRQRQRKRALRDGVELPDADAAKPIPNSTANDSNLIENPRSVNASGTGGLPMLMAATVLDAKKQKEAEEAEARAEQARKKREQEEEDEAQEQKKKEREAEEEEQRIAARNVYVEANPAGYAFPLLSVFAERDRSMRLERMKNPDLMSSEEALLRTLDKITRNEVNSRGKRVRKNPVARIRADRKKRFQKRMYMYDLDHARPTPKYPSAVGGKLFTEMGKVKKPPANWVDIHSKTKKVDSKKAEHFMQLLHKEQVEEAARSQEIAKVQANGDHRRQMKLYNMMKAAQSQDKMVDLMEDAGFLSMPQYIEHCLKSSQLDHVISATMKQQNI